MKTILKLIPALMFSLYTVYHIILLAHLAGTDANANLSGRITGIVIVLIISVASWLAFIPKRSIRTVRTIMLSGALALTFILKIFNAEGIFKRLDFANIPSVLNCAVYILSQLAVLILLIYYILFRHNKKLEKMRKLIIALLSAAAILYALCLIMECVMLIKYRVNIDLSLKYTLASRFLYYFGFIGMAVSFMRPRDKIYNPDEYYNEKLSEAETIVVAPVRDKSHSDRHKNLRTAPVDTEIVFSTKNNRPHSNKHKR